MFFIILLYFLGKYTYFCSIHFKNNMYEEINFTHFIIHAAVILNGDDGTRQGIRSAGD